MDWAELQNWDEYSKLLVGLLALTNPFGSIPVLSSLMDKFPPADKRKVIGMAVLTFTVTLVIFLFLGALILELFGITLGAFRIAGGVMFLFYALNMLGLIQLPNSSESLDLTSARSLGVTPIGIPLLAGPGTISTIILLASDHDSFSHKILVMGVILSVAVIVYVVFQAALIMGKGLGKTGTGIMNKVMGLLLAAIAVEFILDGIVAHFPQLISVH
jgi:multiple antibiotic resistance protein